MMIRKILLIALVMVLFIPVGIRAYQYQDYTWGMSMHGVLDKVEKQNIIHQDKEFIAISKEVLGVSAKIYFSFTPKTKKLFGVTIIWDKTNELTGKVGMDAREVLRTVRKKYGEPIKGDDSGLIKYTWVNFADDTAIFLEEEMMIVSIQYFNKNLYKESIQEQKQ